MATTQMCTYLCKVMLIYTTIVKKHTIILENELN